MLNLLLQPLLGIATEGIKTFAANKAAKNELKLTEIKAQSKRKQDQIDGKIQWEQSAVDQMKGSWKDEFVLLALMLPAIAVFIPGMTEHIEKGFLALNSLPEYYRNLLYLSCSVSMGVRMAPGVKGFLKK